MRREIFPCKKCNGTGGTGPIRPSTGRPFRECVSCNGDGEIYRTVDQSHDAMKRMSETSNRRWAAERSKKAKRAAPTPKD